MKKFRMALIGLSATLACGESGSPTTSDASTGGTGPGTTDAATTGTTTAVPTSSGSDAPTGGSGGGTESGGTNTENASGTSDTSGSGSGGSGSGMACAKWYDAFVESYRPQCECQVSLGMYDSVEDCLAATVPPSSCTCDIFAQSPETIEQLKCYEKAAQDKAECLDQLGLCAGDLMLELCEDSEASALLLCGSPPKEICDAITMMCEDAPLLLCLP